MRETRCCATKEEFVPRRKIFVRGKMVYIPFDSFLQVMARAYFFARSVALARFPLDFDHVVVFISIIDVIET